MKFLIEQIIELFQQANTLAEKYAASTILFGS
jgi:hypothetical protein